MKLLNTFRIIAVLEGISYLLLFAVTMPLKYWAELGYPNKVVGYLHGALFIAYLVMALLLGISLKWGIKKMFWVVLASLLPFGTFYLDQQFLKPLSLQKSL